MTSQDHLSRRVAVTKAVAWGSRHISPAFRTFIFASILSSASSFLCLSTFSSATPSLMIAERLLSSCTSARILSSFFVWEEISQSRPQDEVDCSCAAHQTWAQGGHSSLESKVAITLAPSPQMMSSSLTPLCLTELVPSDWLPRLSGFARSSSTLGICTSVEGRSFCTSCMRLEIPSLGKVTALSKTDASTCYGLRHLRRQMPVFETTLQIITQSSDTSATGCPGNPDCCQCCAQAIATRAGSANRSSVQPKPHQKDYIIIYLVDDASHLWLVYVYISADY